MKPLPLLPRRGPPGSVDERIALARSQTIGVQRTAAMIANPPPYSLFNFDVDSQGDIWLSFDDASDTVVGGALVRRAIWRLARDPNGG